MFAEQAYLFRHAVLRDAAYTLLVPSDRASMHRLVVEIVERVYGDRLADDLAPELATHCRIAREDDADDKLLEKERHYAEIAQNLAFTGYEYAQAISWSNRLAEIATDAARPEVLLRFARSLVLGGRRDEAWEVLERIYAIATNEEHPDVLAWTNMVKVGLLRGDGRMGEAQELADSVIADAERWKPGTRAAVFGSYTLLLQGAGRAAEAETYRKLALEAASQDDVKKTEVRLLLNSIGPLRSSGRVDEAEAGALDAVEAGELGRADRRAEHVIDARGSALALRPRRCALHGGRVRRFGMPVLPRVLRGAQALDRRASRGQLAVAPPAAVDARARGNRPGARGRVRGADRRLVGVLAGGGVGLHEHARRRPRLARRPALPRPHRRGAALPGRRPA